MTGWVIFYQEKLSNVGIQMNNQIYLSFAGLKTEAIMHKKKP